ncbi:MAG: hypothetical protein M1819_005559 [Sarea resinae]|nr:MAG: hypothetical protein M1819_005559 [Sarea resinae]
MGLTDLFSDIYSSLSFTEVHAEAPAEEEKDESAPAEGEEKEEEGGEEGGDEEEEEEEEEPEDPKTKLEEECAESKACSPLKHHYDECVERVTSASDDSKGPKEDCVEECKGPHLLSFAFDLLVVYCSSKLDAII